MKLSDRYTQERGTAYLTGIQALVRLPMDQIRRDRVAGLNNAAFISGYEGSPLAGYDMALLRSKPLLEPLNIHFVPGMNEEIAATSVMGSQMFEVFGGAKFDGVLGIWYGKGPGVDRCGDVFRHANFAGSAKHNAALVLAGDDHSAKSSTIPHQSDLSLFNVGMPVVFPGNSQETLDYGLLAFSMGRHSGAWIGMKMVTNVCDGGGTVTLDPERLSITIPEGYGKVTDSRLVTPVTLALEYELHTRRLDAAREFARVNRLNRFHGARGGASLGIVSTGKAYYDLMQALADLGIRESELPELGIRIAKFGMTYPLEPVFTREFAAGLQTLLVVEEKRSFVEFQLRDLLYSEAQRPVILGKVDADGLPLLPSTGELDPDIIARVIARLLVAHPRESIRARMTKLEEIQSRPREVFSTRNPTFCSGCPHNRSTLLLPGQVAGGGIGCHSMAITLGDMDRGFGFLTQMGGEGAGWIGMAPFMERGHIFQNVGDGTYFHSGSLPVQACIAAGVNITFKILLNGHVSMTGGQLVMGALPVPALTRKLEAEGVKRTVVLTEDTDRYIDVELAANAVLRDRSELERTLAELEKVAGVTVLIYDQECAAEKRRARSRGKQAEPVKRLVIHEEVCEGCGDCVKASNCMSLHPVSTELGQKMQIHQSSCNKDYSCAIGDCPSFLTVKIKPGTGLAKRPVPSLPPADVTGPVNPVQAGDGYRIVMPGIGGTGVLTINALLATAAALEGKQVLTLDQTGLAQKGGAVVSSIVIADCAIEASARVNAGNAHLILGFDLLGVMSAETAKCAHPGRTVAVINTQLTPTHDSIRSLTVLQEPERLVHRINQITKPGRNVFVDASRLADRLFGSHLQVNIFLLGVAFQAGLIPLTGESLQEAVRLNQVDIEKNLQAFLWGRKYYVDAAWVEQQISQGVVKRKEIDRVLELTLYQNEAYARSYRDFMQMVEARAPALKDTVARCLYNLMAYKDEYEVARLLTNPERERAISEMWEAAESVSYNLHPPFLRKFGVKRKLQLGPWFRFPLRMLAKLKVLRGTPLDVFGLTAHRREERSLAGWYRKLVEEVIANQGTDALETVALPEQIRGYEGIKEESILRVKRLAAEKLLVHASLPVSSPFISQ